MLAPGSAHASRGRKLSATIQSKDAVRDRHNAGRPAGPKLIGLVAAGVGIAIVPADMNCIRFEGIEYKRLADAEAYSTLYLACREADDSVHLRTLLKMLNQRSTRSRNRNFQ